VEGSVAVTGGCVTVRGRVAVEVEGEAEEGCAVVVDDRVAVDCAWAETTASTGTISSNETVGCLFILVNLKPE
jgi:hypothetical protein